MSFRRLGLLGALPLLLLTGCASYYLSTADRAAERGDWDRASKYYGKLVESEPESADARAKLKHAREEAAAMHVARGRALASEGKLAEAISAFRRSLQYKEDPATLELLERTIAAKRKADAEEEVLAATRAEDAGDLLSARSAYERARALDESRAAELGRRIARLDQRMAEASDLASQAQAQLLAGDLQAAERLAAQAVELYGASDVARQVSRDVQSERTAREHEANAGELAAEGRLDDAVASAQQSLEARDSDARRALLADLRSKAADLHLELGAQAFLSEDWEAAIEHYQSALAYQPDLPAAQQGLASSRYENALSLAREADAAQLASEAIEHYQSAYALRQSPEILERIRYLESTLGRFRAVYARPRSASYVGVYQQLSQSGLLEGLTANLNEAYRVPADVTLATQECGHANAFYLPAAAQVSLCYELVAQLALQFRDQPRYEELFTGTFVFILMHELGHAFAHIYQLPITGREEDAADQLAAAVLLEMEGGAQLAVAAAAWFSSKPHEAGALAFADEHSLGQQRFFNLLCWVYGKDPVANRAVLEHLPARRAQRCPAEYQQMKRSWESLLAPYER